MQREELRDGWKKSRMFVGKGLLVYCETCIGKVLDRLNNGDIHGGRPRRSHRVERLGTPRESRDTAKSTSPGVRAAETTKLGGEQ